MSTALWLACGVAAVALGGILLTAINWWHRRTR